MPANMMIAPMGSPRAKTTGSSRAIVTEGPSPGSTPTAVPMAAPARAYSRYSGWRTVPNALKRLTKESTGSQPPGQDADGQVHVEQPHEDEVQRQREEDGDDEVAPPVPGRDVGR